MAKYSLVMTPTPCGVAGGGIVSIRPTYSCAVYLLTDLLSQNNQCFWRLWPVI